MKRISTLFSVNILCGILLNQATAMQQLHQPAIKSTNKHGLSTEAPEYVTSFIDLFKQGNITSHDFDQKMGQVFSGLEISPMFFPMKEFHILASFVEQSGTKEAVFKLFHELEINQPNQMYNDNRKRFFILNHLLGNPETITLAEKYLKEYLQTATWFDQSLSTYAYVLLDSGTTEDQQLALQYLDMMLNEPAGASFLPSVVNQLTFVKDQHKLSSFLEGVLKKLPDYRQTLAWNALQIAGNLLNHPIYHEQALAFIEDTLKLKELQMQNPYTLVAQALLQVPSSKEYAMRLIEDRILPHMALKAKDKAQSINIFHTKDKEKSIQYLNTIWKVNSDDENRIQLLFEIINVSELREFVFPKIMEYFDKIMKPIKAMPDNEIGMNFGNLIRFFAASDPEVLGKMKGEMSNLLYHVFQLPPIALPMIQADQVITLIQKSGLDAHEILLSYSELPSVDSQFFINLSRQMADWEKFLVGIYKSPKTASPLKRKLLIEFANIIRWNQNFQQILNRREIINDLFELLQNEKEFREQINIYQALITLNDPDATQEVLTKIAHQFKGLHTINHKYELFSIIAYNNAIDKQSEAFKTMVHELSEQVRNPSNYLQLRRNIANVLRYSNSISSHSDYFIMLEHLHNLEEKIKREVFEIGTQGASEIDPHASLAINKLKFIVNKLLEDFHSYQFHGVPFDQKDLIEKTKAILGDNDLMEKALGGLGKDQMIQYVEEATRNLSILESEMTWNEPNHELESIKIDRKIITTGQIYSLFLYYIERQKEKPSYISLIGGLVQALASSQAMQGCKTGSMSGMGNTTFKEEFKKEGEKEVRSFANYTEVVLTKLIRLKTIMIYLLSQYKTGGVVFDIHNKLLLKYFPDIGNNEFLIETFQIFNQIPLEHIFGDKIHMIAEIFTKASDYKYHPSSEEEKFMKDVNTLIINPAILALLSKEYSDFVVFTPHLRDETKLSFPDYVGIIEEDAAYEPTLISSFGNSVSYQCPDPTTIQQLDGNGTLTAISSNGIAFMGHGYTHITLPSAHGAKLFQVSLENHTKMMCSYEPVNSGVFALEATIQGICNIPEGQVVPNISFHNIYKLCNSPQTCVVDCK